MKLPLLLFDDGDISVFERVEDLERYVESPDVGGYIVFDASGSKFSFGVPVGKVGVRIIDVKGVKLIPAESSVEEVDLVNRIRKFLLRVGVDAADRNSLSEVLDLLIDRVGFTK